MSSYLPSHCPSPLTCTHTNCTSFLHPFCPHPFLCVRLVSNVLIFTKALIRNSNVLWSLISHMPVSLLVSPGWWSFISMYQGPRFKGKSVYLAFLEIFTGFVIHAIYTESNLFMSSAFCRGRQRGRKPHPSHQKIVSLVMVSTVTKITISWDGIK